MRQKLLAAVVVIGLAGAAVAVARSVSTGGSVPRVESARLGAATGVPVRPRPVRAAAAPSYRFTTVTFAGSLDAQISGINDVGAYTGSVVSRAGSRPFVVSPPKTAPVFFQLPFPAAASSVQTAGIDTAGGVAGTFVDPRGVFHGFVRTAAGAYRELDVAGAGTARGEGTEVAGMSAGGVVVGNYLTPANVSVGFIDRDGRISRLVEGSAGTKAGEGTAVEFYSAVGGYGGIYIGPSGAAHGWWVVGGKVRVVDDPAAGPPVRGAGTQLVGVDELGRLYGMASPASGVASAFRLAGEVSSAIRDPRQTSLKTGRTLLLGVNAGGDLAGSYTYDAQGQTRAFIARPGV